MKKSKRKPALSNEQMDQSNACKAYISLSRLRALLILATLQTRLADTRSELAEDLEQTERPGEGAHITWSPIHPTHILLHLR